MQDKFDLCKQAKNPCPTNKIYKAELLKKYNITFPENVFCEDKLFTLQSVYYANGIVAVPDINYYYYKNPNSTVKTRNPQHVRKLIKDKELAQRAVLDFLKSKIREDGIQIRDKEFWAIKKDFFGIFTIKESINTEKLILFKIPIAERTYLDYKRNQINILGLKLKCKREDWIKNANKQNLELNSKNLKIKPAHNGKNILLISSIFVPAGGIETRVLQYAKILKANNWNVFLLSEENLNEELLKLPNFNLNFDATNFDKCLNEIIDFYNISLLEFQFKNPKILKNIDINSLSKKVKIGCTIHNTGVSHKNIINSFDYKIFVSEQMYKKHYRQIKNPTIIKNAICINNNFKKWEFNQQKRAILISRISKDKLKSIEGFIKYCQSRKVEFDIAGYEQSEEKIIKKLIKIYKLKREQFIGKIDTLDYLSKNSDKYLFVGGVGLVILEAGSLGYPCFVCSNFNGGYSFVTKDNIDFFDNFTIETYHEICRQNKKESELDISNLQNYEIDNYILNKRSIEKLGEQYIYLLENYES